MPNSNTNFSDPISVTPRPINPEAVNQPQPQQTDNGMPHYGKVLGAMIGAFMPQLMQNMLLTNMQSKIKQQQDDHQLIINSGLQNPALLSNKGYKKIFDTAIGNKDLSTSLVEGFQQFQDMINPQQGNRAPGAPFGGGMSAPMARPGMAPPTSPTGNPAMSPSPATAPASPMGNPAMTNPGPTGSVGMAPPAGGMTPMPSGMGAIQRQFADANQQLDQAYAYRDRLNNALTSPFGSFYGPMIKPKVEQLNSEIVELERSRDKLQTDLNAPAVEREKAGAGAAGRIAVETSPSAVRAESRAKGAVSYAQGVGSESGKESVRLSPGVIAGEGRRAGAVAAGRTVGNYKGLTQMPVSMDKGFQWFDPKTLAPLVGKTGNVSVGDALDKGYIRLNNQDARNIYEMRTARDSLEQIKKIVNNTNVLISTKGLSPNQAKLKRLEHEQYIKHIGDSDPNVSRFEALKITHMIPMLYTLQHRFPSGPEIAMGEDAVPELSDSKEQANAKIQQLEGIINGAVLGFQRQGPDSVASQAQSMASTPEIDTGGFDPRHY